MSYHRGYHSRRNQRVVEDPYFEDADQRCKNSIIRLGDVDALQEVDKFVSDIQSSETTNVLILSEGIRLGLTEQPYKIPYYALLLRKLCDVPAIKSEGSTGPNSSIGRQVLEDFWKGFQNYLDKLAWREVRFCIHFFAHLTVARVISPQSMLSLLRSFTAVLDEFGVSLSRAKRAARCAAEGLMRAGQPLKAYSSTPVIEIISSFQTYADLVSNSRGLVHPVVPPHDAEANTKYADEIIDCAISAVKALDITDFADTSNVYPQPYTELLPPEFDLYDLPSVLVPPDAMDLDGIVSDTSVDAPIKKEEWPEFYLRLFTDDVTPDPSTPEGYAVRSDVLDIADIFEINRKECARLLLEYPKWTLPGTFKPKSNVSTNGEHESGSGKGWVLESSVVEALLGSQFLLPESHHKTIYYTALITELCKMSPQTVGPAVGKSIRKCYGYLLEGLDVEISRRFAEWFSVHMSNFNFQWVWKEWIDDLNLPIQHPKMAFIRSALEQEIRLSYYERVLKTLPAPFQNTDSGAIPSQAPGPEYAYDDPSSPHYDVAQSLLNRLRARAKAEEVTTYLETLKSQLAEEGETDVDKTIRLVTVQSLLHIGSRSFSHFLNAIERYISLLRGFTSPEIASGIQAATQADAKADVLFAVSSFWSRNRQMVSIVFDKLMQYQIVDPTDIVKWVFAQVEEGLNWDLLRGAVDKANGRVIVARKRISALRKEEDESRARELAKNNSNMEVDADLKAEPTSDSPALSAALKTLAALTREQISTLSLVVEGFVDLLHPSDASSPVYEVVSQCAWDTRSSWSNQQWSAWYSWGWFKHFCRAYSPYLRNFATTLTVVSLAKIEHADDESSRVLKRIWNSAIGQE